MTGQQRKVPVLVVNDMDIPIEEVKFTAFREGTKRIHFRDLKGVLDQAAIRAFLEPEFTVTFEAPKKRRAPSASLSGLNVWGYLQNLRPALPYTAEAKRLDADGRCVPMSNGELQRHINNGAVLINGEKCKHDEPLDFPVFSIVFFPNGARKTTIL